MEDCQVCRRNTISSARRVALVMIAAFVVAARAHAGQLTPYGGSPAPIPGTIQAAQFDEGGEGVAYHDTTPGNAGGVYRATDVDIAYSSEGGYTVGWIAAEEWLYYTVSVATAGSYTAQVRVASPSGGGTMH